ncbi:MAG: peptide chain release factor-like protein, partial [Planctomycetaceae bacterium]|nr:peptide chain release factor-like protein [Planctomycetaceae bacterium]
RNKVETAVHITHLPTGIAAAATERRSQEENRRMAVSRLRMSLAVGHRSCDSQIVEPTELWQSRCRGGRIQCSDRHADFPVLIAEALDAAYAKEFDVRQAAAALGCSTTQLIRFLGRVPDALQQVNAGREARGLNRLRA